jgi:AcrR family transcriptional regulator
MFTKPVQETPMPRAPLTESQVRAGRARILKAAINIMGSDGAEALSMRSLAHAVELTPGALYRYFASKDEVMGAVFGGGGALDGRLLATANSRLSDLKAVRQFLKDYADFAFEDELRFRTLFLKHYGPASREFHARGSRRPGVEACKRRIQSAMESGVLRKMDANLALQVLWGAIHGVVALILTAEGFPFAHRSKLVKTAIDNAIRGMMNPTEEQTRH